MLLWWSQTPQHRYHQIPQMHTRHPGSAIRYSNMLPGTQYRSNTPPRSVRHPETIQKLKIMPLAQKYQTPSPRSHQIPPNTPLDTQKHIRDPTRELLDTPQNIPDIPNTDAIRYPQTGVQSLKHMPDTYTQVCVDTCR